MNWHYSDNGQQQGPVSEEEMTRLISKRVITGDTLVWNESLTAWVKFSESSLSSYLEKLYAPGASAVPTPPPLPNVTDLGVIQEPQKIAPPSPPPIPISSPLISESGWYYRNNAESVGPVREDEITCLIQAGEISKNTPLWNESQADWLPLSETKFFDQSKAPSHAGEMGYTDTAILEIAKKQKLILWMIVGGALLAYAIGDFGLHIADVFYAILVYQLAVALKSKFAWVYVVLSLIPFVSFVVLLVMNQKATRVLKLHDLKVGFMGISSSEMAALKTRMGTAHVE